jgi:hypothetical protein
MDSPSMTPRFVTALAVDPSASSEPIEVAAFVAGSEFDRREIARREVARSEVIPQPQTVSAVVPAPELFSAPPRQMAGFAASVTPVSSIEPPSVPTVSQPFSAVGTAFVKTGAALAFAFKKTGQGILAPF